MGLLSLPQSRSRRAISRLGVLTLTLFLTVAATLAVDAPP